MANPTTTRVLDLAERTVMTYVATVAGMLAADSANMLSLGAVKVAAVAALPALVTAIKSAFAIAFSASGTASVLPAPKPVPGDTPANGMAEPVPTAPAGPDATADPATAPGA